MEHESLLHWVYEQSQTAPLRVKTTCAPHYARIQRQERSAHHAHPDAGACPHNAGPVPRAGGDPDYVSGGCLAGGGFVFISHQGVLQTCGFLDVPCGDLRKAGYDFHRAYLESAVFNEMRSREHYSGKCGLCEFKMVCGGCRARAYAHNGDFLGAEPTCVYTPRRLTRIPTASGRPESAIAE